MSTLLDRQLVVGPNSEPGRRPEIAADDLLRPSVEAMDALGQILLQLGQRVPFQRATLALRNGASLKGRRRDDPDFQVVPLAEFETRLTPEQRRQLLELNRSLLLPEEDGSSLAVPMVRRGQRFGILALHRSGPPSFAEAEAEPVFACGQQVATSLENARLYVETRRRAAEFELLYRVSHAASTLDLDSALAIIHRETTAALNPDGFTLALYDADRDELDFRIMVSGGQMQAPFRRPQGQAPDLGDWILRSRVSLLVGDLQRDRASLPAPVALDDERSRCLIAVPMEARGRLVGVLSIQSARPDEYGPDTLRLMEAIARQAAIAIENARLYRQTEDRAHELAESYARLQTSYRELGEMARALERKDAALGRANEALDRRAARLLALNHLSQRLWHLHEANAVFAATALAVVDGMGLDLCLMVVDSPGGLRPVALAGPTLPEHGLGHWLERSPAGEAIRIQAPICIPDRRAHPRWATDPACESIGLHSFLAIPFKPSPEVWGAILVGMRSGSPRVDEEDLDLFSILAGQVAGACRNADLIQQTNRQIGELTSLYDLAQKATSSLDLPIVLDAIVHTLQSILHARAASIALIESETNTLVIRAATGIKDQWLKQARLKVGEGISGRAAQTARPVYVADTHREPNFIFFDPIVRSLLVVPLIVRNRVIGTLAVDSDLPDAFGPEDERLLTIAAAQAAVAIDNAQLYEDLKGRYAALQQLEQLRDELIQNVSHELRTPLTFIKSYVDLLLEEQLGPLGDRQRRSLELVAAKTAVLSRLVRDIVSIQQIERRTLQLGEVSLEEIARLAIESAELSAQAQGLYLRLETPDALRPVIGDRERLLQVFDNLLNNAVKFSLNGGEIVVRLIDQGSHVLASVADQGIGIPEDQLERIFERFYQVDGSAKRRYGGIGLGLAIVQKIIEAHGGRAWAESKVGQGTTLFFSAPYELPDGE